MITAEIIADSINPSGNRLTTFVLEYPRFVHSEFLTHRMFSKNAASSRAIPIEKMIQQVIDNPAMPVWWGRNQSGMQANEELDDINEKSYAFNNSSRNTMYFSELMSGTDKSIAKNIWLQARDRAICEVRKLNEIGLHKQIANRILEPWFNIRVICSATEYGNFFALRAHKDAQPEIRTLSETMLDAYNNSEPQKLKTGEWHIPFGDKIENSRIVNMVIPPAMMSGEDSVRAVNQFNDLKRKIAIARCARVSYFNYEGKDDYYADIKLCDRLFSSIPRHLSPTEHVAQALDKSEFIGNFCGFKQYRKFFSQENLTDPRINERTT